MGQIMHWYTFIFSLWCGALAAAEPIYWPQEFQTLAPQALQLAIGARVFCLATSPTAAAPEKH
jgi:hypothetical protein